jgi:hypothetical protein
MTLTPEQLRLVIVIYTSAVGPLVLIFGLRWFRVIPEWVAAVYIEKWRNIQ